MPRDGSSARLTIHLDGSCLWHHRPAYAELVHRARRDGLAGASVFRGFSGRLRTEGPCALVIVDDAERLRLFVRAVDEVLEQAHALVLLEPVQIRRP
ncbi:DUF190 domain-containing protein [Streptomyces sp. NPDC048172]|uniref:DUF190 domain-containing protein n=1 Tax=Streptomyces sp. NPDC048172 TaxID=3365505 RepID=UPI0037232D4B